MEVVSEVNKLHDNALRTNTVVSLANDFTEHKLSRLFSDSVIATSSKRLLANELVAEAKNIQLGMYVCKTMYQPAWLLGCLACIVILLYCVLLCCVVLYYYCILLFWIDGFSMVSKC